MKPKFITCLLLLLFIIFSNSAAQAQSDDSSKKESKGNPSAHTYNAFHFQSVVPGMGVGYSWVPAYTNLPDQKLNWQAGADVYFKHSHTRKISNSYIPAKFFLSTGAWYRRQQQSLNLKFSPASLGMRMTRTTIEIPLNIGKRFILDKWLRQPTAFLGVEAGAFGGLVLPGLTTQSLGNDSVPASPKIRIANSGFEYGLGMGCYVIKNQFKIELRARYTLDEGIVYIIPDYHPLSAHLLVGYVFKRKVLYKSRIRGFKGIGNPGNF